MANQAQATAQAKTDYAITEAQLHLASDTASAQARRDAIAAKPITDPSFEHIKPTRPRRRDPASNPWDVFGPPRRARRGEQPFDINRWLDNMAARGVSLRAGDLPFYGMGGNSSVFGAMGEAHQLIINMAKFVAEQGLQMLQMIPGPIGVVANGAGAILDIARGDFASAGWRALAMIARVDPCSRNFLGQVLVRGANAALFVRDGVSAMNAFREGNAAQGVMSLLNVGSNLFGMFRACFTGDTLIKTPEGLKRIDQVQLGDQVLSRSEFNEAGAVESREVVATFVRVAPVWNLHVGGRIIETTAAHPFYAVGRGWIPTRRLRIGDKLLSDDGQTVQVEGVAESGRIETVYNIEVDEHHTYFVSGNAWEFSVWAHNQNYGPTQAANKKLTRRQKLEIMRNAGVRGTRLVEANLRSAARNVRRGAQFQVDRGWEYYQKGELRAFEHRVSRSNTRRVDLLLKDGTRIDTKSWYAWDSLSGSVRRKRLETLRAQVTEYTKRGDLRLEFKHDVPAEVDTFLRSLGSSRLSWPSD